MYHVWGAMLKTSTGVFGASQMFVRAACVILLSLIKCAHADPRSFYFVANIRPPDNFLALRSVPSARYGQRLETMPNGTKLNALQKNTNGWWFVRDIETGAEGWAFAGHPRPTWISCCVDTSGSSIYAISSGSASLYTPRVGSSERMHIMNAIRSATQWAVVFNVHHLTVKWDSGRGLAVAQVSDNSNATEDAGIFLLESIGGKWRALYSINGGGGESNCRDEAEIADRMMALAFRYSVPHQFFPPRFWEVVEANKSSDDCYGTVSAQYFTQPEGSTDWQPSIKSSSDDRR